MPSCNVDCGSAMCDHRAMAPAVQTRLGAGAVTVDGVVAALDEEGFCIVEGLLPPDELATTRSALIDILEAIPTGRNDFEGFKTQRIYGLFAKTRRFDSLAMHPLLTGVLDRLLVDYQLCAPAGICIGPGEEAQRLHRDDNIYPLGPEFRNVIVNTMWAFDDFTDANGATRMVPGSHRSDGADGPEVPMTVPAVMPAGSVLFYLGKLLHGGGANTTDRPRLGVILEYVASWLRPQENHVLAVPREVAASLPARLQELLGYNMHGVVGHVDGRHPRNFLARSTT